MELTQDLLLIKKKKKSYKPPAYFSTSLFSKRACHGSDILNAARQLAVYEYMPDICMFTNLTKSQLLMLVCISTAYYSLYLISRLT